MKNINNTTSYTRFCVLIMLSSLVDALATLWYIQHGGAEANPLMQYCIDIHISVFLYIKLIMTGTGTMILLLFLPTSRLARAGIQIILWVYWFILMYHLFLIFALYSTK